MRRKDKITQIQTIFYRLYKHFKSEKREEYIPIFEFMGEVYVEELGKWGWMSYELPARFADIKNGNPGLLEQKLVTGKSGAKYYAYRLTLTGSYELIKDEKLVEFYKLIKAKSRV